MMANNTLLSLVRRVSSHIDQVQAKYLSEPCIQVNEFDQPIGKITKEACHSSPTLHRAFSVFLFDSERRLLLQKRSSTKITFPNTWTNSCCSHPHYNELEMEDTVGIGRAAYRKLHHELGITPSDLDRLHTMGKFIYKANSDDKWVEHELDYVIIVKNFEGIVIPNPEEVSATMFVSKDQLHSMAASNVKFSPWFSLFMTHNYLNSWWDNLNSLDEYKDLASIHKLN